MSNDMPDDYIDTFIEFFDDNTYFVYSYGDEGIGIYSIDGNVISLMLDDSEDINLLTMSADHQTLIASDEYSSKLKKETTTNSKTITLSGSYIKNPTPYGYSSYDNRPYGTYYEFFEDYTYKEFEPNGKDASSTGTYTAEGNILKIFPSNYEGHYEELGFYVYIISSDGNTLTRGPIKWLKK